MWLDYSPTIEFPVRLMKITCVMRLGRILLTNILLDILDRGVGYVKISKSKEGRKRKRNCHLSPSCSPLKSLFTNRSHEWTTKWTGALNRSRVYSLLINVLAAITRFLLHWERLPFLPWRDVINKCESGMSQLIMECRGLRNHGIIVTQKLQFL